MELKERAYTLFHCDDVEYNLLDYKMIVATVCSYLADLNRVLDEADLGVEVNKEYVTATLEHLEESKTLLLKIKEQLGLRGGLESFSSDLNLFGGEFRNGRFKIHPGHEETYREETRTAAERYINDFTLDGNPFTYEEMSMLLFFCYPLDKVDYKTQQSVVKEKTSIKSFFKSLLGKKNKEVSVA